MSRTTPALPAPLLALLHAGSPALLLTAGEDGFPNIAYTWVAAPDVARARFGADHGSASLANLKREGRASLAVIAGGNLVFLVKGTARTLKDRIASASFRMALMELAVTEVKDQSWPGVVVSPLAYQWPPEKRDEMETMERAVYRELREA